MENCPRCGEKLEYDEVDVGVGVIRANPGCFNCFWTPDIIDENSKCELHPTGTHSFTLAENTQCEFCLKFKSELPEGMEGIDYGETH